MVLPWRMKCDRRAFDDGDTQLIGHQPHYGRMLHPRQLFQGRPARTQGDEEDIAAQVGSENGEELGARYLAVAHDLDGRRGGNAEAGIVTEKVAYTDRQQQQYADREDDCCRGANTTSTAGGDKPATNRNSAP